MESLVGSVALELAIGFSPTCNGAPMGPRLPFVKFGFLIFGVFVTFPVVVVFNECWFNCAFGRFVFSE